MCSVRHSPMPSAPKPRDSSASSGLSALARTPSVRNSSAHSRMVSRSPVISGSTSSTAPSTTEPVVPSMEIMSPSLMTMSVPTTLACFFSASMRSASTPQTHGAPMPRAMTAACDVLPPCEVRMPSAAIMPARSSGFVSQRTSTHLRPASATATASAAENTASPTAAPGDAFRPLATTS